MRKPMRTRVVTKLVKRMSWDEYQACSHLRVRHGSRLASDLLFHRTDPDSKRAVVVMLKDDRDRVLSYGLIDYDDGVRPTVQLYTHWRWRRRGFGSRVMARVRKLLGDNFKCFRHDEQSTKFFNAVGA